MTWDGIPKETVRKYATPGCKKVRGQSEAALQIGICNQKP